jgi:exopolysaccharide biosynthesis protein
MILRKNKRYIAKHARKLDRPTGAPKSSRWYRRAWGKYLISFGVSMLTIAACILFALYGPISLFRVTLITSAMTTKDHQSLAEIFFSDETINWVLEHNKVIELDSTTDTNAIDTSRGEEERELITIREISGGSIATLDYYEGYIMEISDPAWVRLGIPKDFGTKGQKLPRLIESYNALAGINAGGFADVGGFGNGGNAVGMVMVDGVMIKRPFTQYVNLVGIDNNNVLVLGRYKASELDSLNLRCACEFDPFLIINGEPAEIRGDGGWGSAPRTAIGQRKDGTIIFVVIDGRNPPVIGASMKQLQDIMIEEECWNAVNLDGGSSSVMYYTEKAGSTEEGVGKVLNNPSGSDADGMRFLPNAFLVVDPETYDPPTDRPPHNN